LGESCRSCGFSPAEKLKNKENTIGSFQDGSSLSPCP